MGDHYDAAKADPIAAPILDALQDQDAATYHGQTTDKAQTALDLAATIAPSIRRAERHRLADLLERDADTLAQFVTDPTKTLRLVALMLRLDAETTTGAELDQAAGLLAQGAHDALGAPATPPDSPPPAELVERLHDAEELLRQLATEDYRGNEPHGRAIARRYFEEHPFAQRQPAPDQEPPD